MKIRPGYIFIECKYNYPPSLQELEKALKDWARLGFNYIELEAVTPEHMKDIEENKDYIKKLCQDLGLTVSAFIIIVPGLPSLSSDKRAEVLDMFDRGVKLAEFFGCDLVDLDSFTPSGVIYQKGIPYIEAPAPDVPCEVILPPQFSWEKQWEAFVEIIAQCARRANEAGIKLEIHPRSYEIIHNTDSFLRLAEVVKDMNLGIILDTAHLYVQKEVLPISINKLRGKIWSVHVSDNDGFHMEHLPVGKGTIDWVEVIKALDHVGFDGQFVIDVGGVPNEIDEKFAYSKKAWENLMQNYRKGCQK